MPLIQSGVIASAPERRPSETDCHGDRRSDGGGREAEPEGSEPGVGSEGPEDGGVDGGRMVGGAGISRRGGRGRRAAGRWDRGRCAPPGVGAGCGR